MDQLLDDETELEGRIIAAAKMCDYCLLLRFTDGTFARLIPDGYYQDIRGVAFDDEISDDQERKFCGLDVNKEIEAG